VTITASRCITHDAIFYLYYPTGSPTSSQSQTRTGSLAATGSASGTKAATGVNPTGSLRHAERHSLPETPMATVLQTPTASVSLTYPSPEISVQQLF
jgi:hypothetical protein